MTLDFYYSKQHEKVMKEMNINEMVKEVLDYCMEHYGPIIFTDETGKLKLVQLPAFMFGDYASVGMSGMGESSFSAESLNDPLSGPSSQEVMAHEIVHQWWGLCEEELPKIFQAFYRVEKSRNRQTGGSGLGLYLVKMILDLHEAEYHIENTASGVQFSFLLS